MPNTYDVPEYLRVPIPEQVRDKLAYYFNVKALSDLQGKRLSEVWKEINSKLGVSYNSDKKRYSFLKEKDEHEFISLKSLRSYFKDPPENIKKKKLSALLVFLDTEVEDIEQSLRQLIYGKDKENSYIDFLGGAWSAYVFDSTNIDDGNIKCIPFWLSRDDKNLGYTSFDVNFKNPWKKNNFQGKARILNENSIVFDLLRNEMQLNIFAELPPIGTRDRNDIWILNGIAAANGYNGRPIKANLILIKPGGVINDDKDQYMSREITSYGSINTFSTAMESSYQEQSQSSKINSVEGGKIADGLSDEQRNQIVFYLSREENRDKALRAFLPNTFAELRKRNIRYDKAKGRSEYERIKARLEKNTAGYGYFAFNRYRPNKSEVALFNYTFEFNDENRVCWAVRHRIGQTHQDEFAGEVTLENEKLFFEMQDKEGQRRKQVIAPFSYESDQQHIIKAITSSVSTINYQILGLREIIIYLKEEDLALSEREKADGYISYKRFYELREEIINLSTKLYLADRNNCVLTYPEKSNSKHVYSRQDKACRYNGQYIMFCKGQRTTSDSLLKIILDIDPLSQAMIRVNYDKNVYRVYKGECEAYSVNLKIQGFLAADHSSDQRNIVLIFDCIKEGYQLPDIYTGIVLATDDREGKAVAYSFLAIKMSDFLTSKSDFKDVVNELPEEIAVDKFIQLYEQINKIRPDFNEFFWKKFTDSLPHSNEE